MTGQRTPPSLSGRAASLLRQGWRGVHILCQVLGLLIRATIIAGAAVGLGAGLPWALVRFIGWPLPDHVPTRADWELVPLMITGAPFILDVIACVLWVLWAILMLSVAACLVDVARGLRWDEIQAQAGPVRRLIAGLLAAVLLSWLGRGAASATPATSAGGGVTVEGRGTVVATAPAQPGPTPSWTRVTDPQEDTPGAHAPGGGDGDAGAPPGTERVRPQVNGVHDSLWRMAQRCLGDGDRWPEIWALNHGTAQPHGRTLTNPNLIHPGDLLRLPTTVPDLGAREPAVHSSPTPPSPPTPSPDTSGALVPGEPSRTVSPQPDASGVYEAGEEQGRPGGVSWGPEVFVSLGVAAAISAALALARLRHRARYRPGSGTRGDDVQVAPVVYELNLAHIQARNYDEDQEIFAEAARDAAEAGEPTIPSIRTDTRVARHASVQVLPPRQRQTIHTGTTTRWPLLTPDIALTTSTTAGGAEGRALALDLARAHGLGFVGPGAHAAARALLLTVLTTATPDTATVVIPADDLTALLGVPMRAVDLPRAIDVVADLDAALASLEPALLPGTDKATPGRRPRVLVASPPGDERLRTRLQGLLDNGALVGIAALLLGQWQPGITAYVNKAGTISATSPGPGAALRGSRAFTLPDTAARDLLAFLRTTGSASSAGERSAGDAETPAVAPGQPMDSGRSPTAGNAGLEITSLPDAGTAEVGRVVLLHTPGEKGQASGTGEARIAPLVLSVFGTPSLAWRPDPTQPDQLRAMSAGFSRRLLDLLVLLGVHPAGMSREAVIDALWGEEVPRDPGSVLRTVVSRIRRAVERGTGGAVTKLVLVDRGQYTLAPGVVEVDFWAFSAAVARRRAATTDHARLEAYEAIVDSYGGALADGFATDWLTAAREVIRRDALEGVAALARARVHDDPTATLELLETARAFDPHNELLYRDIMRLEHTLGRHSAISRTLTLLTTRLTEIDAAPTPATIDLAARLRDLDTGITTTATPHDRPGV